MKIVFAHGWGCGPEIWHPILHQLGRSPENTSLEIACVDFGFFGQEYLPNGHYDLAVGHSFGFLWLLHQQELTFDRLLSINGITRFFADRDIPFGTHSRVIERMAKKMEESPSTVLADFTTTCGADSLRNDFPDYAWLQPTEDLACDRQRLQWGLEGLNNWDQRSQLEVYQTKQHSLRVIASTDDRVVTRQLTEACFHHQEIHWHATDCHLLPLIAAEICTETLQQMIDEH
jgi:pimeloyl-[acyl-carrier protein] methyl ester esterase